jgi:FixJ family two-component response regulator
VSGQALISVIDDDESLCRAIVELLRSVGYDALAFLSAEAFLAADGLSGCNCVITDIQLPGLSGIDLTQVLATRQSSLPIIMITARADPGLEERALSSGAIALLRKPFKADALIGCLERALARPA